MYSVYSVKWYDKMPMHYADGLHIAALRRSAKCVARMSTDAGEPREQERVFQERCFQR